MPFAQQFQMRVRILIVGFLLWYLLPSIVHAALARDDSALSGLPSHHLSRWTLQDGAPADIWAMTQSEDDMLWLGTGTGLYRFDGQSFSYPGAPQSKHLTANITALAHGSDGSLWMGYFSGGVSVLRSGRLQHFPPGTSVPRGMVFSIALDRAGRTWVATAAGLSIYDGSQWLSATALGYPVDRADWVIVDRRGSVWATTGEKLVELPLGTQIFRDAGIKTSHYSVLAESPDGRIWISDQVYGTRDVDGDSARPLPAQVRSQLRETVAKRLWFSPDGGLWGTDAQNGGLFYVPAVPADANLRRFDASDGLTSNVAVPGLVDREGNTWIGTNLGLNRLRQRSALTPSLTPPLTVSDYSWSKSEDGMVVIGSAGIIRALRGNTSVPMGNLPTSASLLLTDDGTHWAMDRGHLLRIQGAGVETFSLPGRARKESVLAFALSNHIPYASIAGQGLFSLEDGKWIKQSESAGDAPLSLAGTADVLWLGFEDGRLERWSPRGRQVYGEVDGLSAGAIRALGIRRDGILVIGDRGLSWLSGQHFRTLPNERIGQPTGVTGIAVDYQDTIWLNTIKGAMRVSSKELDRAYLHPNTGVAYRLFDSQDGMPGVAIQSWPVSTALAADDRIWLATNGGLAWLSPSSIQASKHRPKSKVLSIRGNGVEYTPRGNLHLPSGTTSLQFDFTAPSLSSLQGVRFRYILDGLEDTWHESSARQALYSNLKPGTYRFVVAAANSDGLWSEDPAIAEVILDRALWQSSWFKVSCIVALLSGLLLAYWHHVQQITARMRLRVAERYLERERIARELHDTLLQGLQGLILRLGSIAMRLPDARHREELERALVRAEEMLVESRDRVGDLRSECRQEEDLPGAFHRIIERMQPASSVQLIVISNRAIQLSPTAQDDVYRIGQEAILNAYRHAQATRIDVSLDYRPHRFTLTVQDDGVGLEHCCAERSAKSGHWGLAGMRERAQRLGASLQVLSNSGTRVTLVIPANRAYDQPSPLGRLLHRTFKRQV